MEKCTNCYAFSGSNVSFIIWQSNVPVVLAQCNPNVLRCLLLLWGSSITCRSWVAWQICDIARLLWDGLKEAPVLIPVTFKLEKDVRLGLLGQLYLAVILFNIDHI